MARNNNNTYMNQQVRKSGRQADLRNWLTRIGGQLESGDFSQEEYNRMPLDQQKILRNYRDSPEGSPFLQDTGPGQWANMTPDNTREIPFGQEFAPDNASPRGRIQYGPNRDPAYSARTTGYLEEPALQGQPLAPVIPQAQAQAAPQGFWSRFKAGLANQASYASDNSVSSRK